MKRRLLILTACTAWLSTGCSKSPDSNSTGGETKSRGMIGVSLLTLDNPFFKVIGDHITSEGSKHGYQTIVVSGDKDVARQGNQIKDFIVKKVSAIVLSPCDSKSIIPVIQEANAAGIPVFTVDIPCNEPRVKIVTQVATDNYGGGKEAARAMIEALGEAGGKIAVLHLKQAESCILRVKGFTEIINAHNAGGKAKVDIVTELECGGAKDGGYKAAEDAVQAHADLRGIFAINDPAALGARAALEKAGVANRIFIIGFDGQPEGKQAIKDGKIYADPIQYPEKMGV
jgi:ribose transport system substrate-binding protein